MREPTIDMNKSNHDIDQGEDVTFPKRIVSQHQRTREGGLRSR